MTPEVNDYVFMHNYCISLCYKKEKSFLKPVEKSFSVCCDGPICVCIVLHHLISICLLNMLDLLKQFEVLCILSIGLLFTKHIDSQFMPPKFLKLFKQSITDCRGNAKNTMLKNVRVAR